MKKLTGTDLAHIIKASINNEELKKEASLINANDYVEDDVAVKYFLKVFPGGLSGESFKKATSEKVIKVASNMTEIRDNVYNIGLRKAHALLQNVAGIESDLVTFDNKLESVNESDDINIRIKSAKLLNFLSKYASSSRHKETLSEASKNVVSGEISKAMDKIKTVFSKQDIVNNRIAHVTVKQQEGLGYQMCPKSIYIFGKPSPMEISSCRDYCIDVRIDPDGSVGCNYSNWINSNVITQNEALNLFDKLATDQVTMNLEKGQRSKFPASDEDSLETMLNHTGQDIENFEDALENSRKKSDAKPVTKKVKVEEKSIEELLEGHHEYFSDDELDNLEEMLRKSLE